MAKDEEPEEATDATEEGEEPKKKKLSGKTLTMFVGGPVVLIGVIVGALFFLGILGGGSPEEAEGHGEGAEALAEESAHTDPSQLVFYEIPEIVTNLKSDGRGSSFLKLSVSLELDKTVKIEELEPLMPRIIDQFQVYLRELRLDDLSGSAGMFRLKEELLRRVNLAADPIEVHDVLFKEMIVQ